MPTEPPVNAKYALWSIASVEEPAMMSCTWNGADTVEEAEEMKPARVVRSWRSEVPVTVKLPPMVVSPEETR